MSPKPMYKSLVFFAIVAISAGFYSTSWWGAIPILLGLAILAWSCIDDGGQFRLVGPFAWTELIRSARGSGRHAKRSMFVMAMFAGLVVFYLSAYRDSSSTKTAIQLKQLIATNEAFFNFYFTTLMITVPMLTVSWAANIILEERDGKRWDILRTTHLTSREIIVGKALGRLPVAFDPITTTFPVLAIMSLMGGYSPLMLVLSILAIVTLSFGLGCMTLFYATFAKKADQANGSAIGIYVLYLVGSAMPFLWRNDFAVRNFPKQYWAGCPITLDDFIAILQSGNPFVHRSSVMGDGLEAMLVHSLPAFMAFHSFIGLSFLCIAIVRLRTAMPWDAKTAANQVVAKVVGKTIDRPSVTDDSVAWWERYGQFSGFPLMMAKRYSNWFDWRIVLFSFLIAITTYFVRFFNESRHQDFAGVYTFAVWCLSWPAIMGPMFRASSSIYRERKQDTLELLLLTRLSQEEILKQKVRGAIESERPVHALIATLLIMGILTTSIPIIAGLLFGVGMIVIAWGATWFGMYVGVASNRPRGTLIVILVCLQFVCSIFVWPPVAAGLPLLAGFNGKSFAFFGILGICIWLVIGWASNQQAVKAFQILIKDENFRVK